MPELTVTIIVIATLICLVADALGFWDRLDGIDRRKR